MKYVLPLLSDTMRTATFFEEAGLALLRQLLTLVSDELAKSRFAGKAAVLRGQIHLRSDSSYRQVLVVSRSDETSDWAIEHSAKVPALAHRSSPLSDQKSAASPELSGGRAQPQREAKPSATERRFPERAAAADVQFESSSQANATHLFTAPLRSKTGGMEGKVCLEVFCPAALGGDFIWDSCTERLQACCDIAAPFLLQLPPQAGSAVPTDSHLPVLGASMAKVVQVLRVFARQEETVLISGPTGAGKSRLARWCHDQSSRKRGPFESLDLSSIPETLQLGELVGWKKGAFTDAQQDTPGAIARAEGGTLFIDEIDKLSLKAQAGLLSILEERRYRALGDRNATRQANIRFLIGTNADLTGAVQAGRFREDLYYRINVLPVKVPPLSERRDEIVAWASYMLQRRHGQSLGVASIADSAATMLVEQAWPGNLRQLDNIIRRAYALRLLDDLKPGEGLTLQRRHIEQALEWENAAVRMRPLSVLLRDSAEEFVRIAGERPLDLDLADAFRGFVLIAAIDKLGSRDAAFRLLGKEQLVRGRNHQKVLKREIDRAMQLITAAGEKSDLALDRIDKGDEVEQGENA